jgi:hypothetical protein
MDEPDGWTASYTVGMHGDVVNVMVIPRPSDAVRAQISTAYLSAADPDDMILRIARIATYDVTVKSEPDVRGGPMFPEDLHSVWTVVLRRRT